MSWGDGEEEDLQETEEDPLWRIVTAADEIVCPDCSPLEGEVYPESIIFEALPDAEEVADGVVQLNVHGRCRCTAFAEEPSAEYAGSGSDIEEGGAIEVEDVPYAGGFF